jgi:hypothetical protein
MKTENNASEIREYSAAVPKKTQDKWLTQWRAGDNQKIHEAAGLSKTTIVNAIKNGRATQSTIDKINGYYESVNA